MSSSPSEPHPPGDEPTSDGRLDSWKEIASYLRRSVRSAKRWEKSEGLPVHRHLHDKRDSVYAYRAELDGWWSNRGATPPDSDGAEAPASPAEPESLAGDTVVEEPGRDRGIAPSSSRATHRAALIGVGFALAIVLVGAVSWLSRGGSRAATGSLRPLSFKARDWVLVAAFENRSGQPLLDGTLDYALARELSNSRYVNVVPPERVADALRLMRKPLDARLDAPTAREVCLRDGDIRAVIAGQIERIGPKYVLNVELLDPRGALIASASEEAVRNAELLSATRRISDRVRAWLGENPPPARESEGNLPKVTTPSLRALQLYSQADALIAAGNSAAAEELLRHAVADDREFASAHIHLAHAIHNQGRPEEDYRPSAETAFRLSDGTTERERYFIRGSYYDLLGQKGKAITAYEALLSLYPDHYWGIGNLEALYHSEGRFREAVELRVRLADLRPKEFLANETAAFYLAPLDWMRARPYVYRALGLVSQAIVQEWPGSVAWLETTPSSEGWLDGNLTRALQVADGLNTKIDSLSGQSRPAFVGETFGLYLMLGRLEAATGCIQKAPSPFLRHQWLSWVEFLRNDLTAMRAHLKALGGAGPKSPGSAILMARVGLLSDAASLLTRIETEDAISIPGYLQITRGELALARGEVDEGIRELEEGTRRVGDFGYVQFFLGSESLGKAWRRKGNLTRAVWVLERASEKRAMAAFERAGSLWLRNQMQLARLYRETGRAADAQTIEAELLKLLAVADRDHPILLDLRRLQES
jgi:tetratricopeptide (TPR) repeat protein